MWRAVRSRTYWWRHERTRHPDRTAWRRAGGDPQRGMSRRWVAGAVAAAGVVLAGCGSGGSGSAGNVSRTGFRHAYAAAEPTLRSISAGLAAAASSDLRAGRAGATAQSDRRSALASAAVQEAGMLGRLGPPPRYNTELRDISTALSVSADDLGAMSIAVADRDPRAQAAAAGSLREDAANVSTAAARLAGSLGLAPGS